MIHASPALSPHAGARIALPSAAVSNGGHTTIGVGRRANAFAPERNAGVRIPTVSYHPDGWAAQRSKLQSDRFRW